MPYSVSIAQLHPLLSNLKYSVVKLICFGAPLVLWAVINLRLVEHELTPSVWLAGPLFQGLPLCCSFYLDNRFLLVFQVGKVELCIAL